MKSNYGHIKGGGDITVCRNCNHTVYMTSDYRLQSTSELTILHHLDKIEKCCDKPDYNFENISIYGL